MYSATLSAITRILESPIFCTNIFQRPKFDSPSVFCRLLDANKGGYYSITPTDAEAFTTKQQYLPSSAILQTRYIHDDGALDVLDYFPRPKTTSVPQKCKSTNHRDAVVVQDELKQWVVRRVECIRGKVAFGKWFPSSPSDHEKSCVLFVVSLGFELTHCRFRTLPSLRLCSCNPRGQHSHPEPRARRGAVKDCHFHFR